LTLHWLLTGAAVLTAGVALVIVRRQNKRLERLSESYWELRYEHGQLRAHVNRLDPGTHAAKPEAEPPASNFIPLSSLKR
jgi:hypothetical protein